MKIGQVEGTPEEIKDLFENTGTNVLEYLQQPEQTLASKWLIIPAVLFIITCFISLWIETNDDKVTLSLFLLGFILSVWLAISVNIKYKTSWGATAIIFAGVLIMLLSLQLVKPEQLPKYYDPSVQENNS